MCLKTISSFPYAGTDPEETILNAFKLFDEDNSGKIGED